MSRNPMRKANTSFSLPNCRNTLPGRGSSIRYVRKFGACFTVQKISAEYRSRQYSDLQKANLYVLKCTVHSYFYILDTSLCLIFIMRWQCNWFNFKSIN
jgi:hypothetical protein